MQMLLVAVHAAKSNKDGKYDDYRVITYGPAILKCPVVNMAVYIADKLFLGDRSRPFHESIAESAAWCAFPAWFL